ncbi:MAG: hypothetical protein MUQ27_04200 [Acidimicrobiia bacterium]|nr:hypothetical protein [Acidimicrobiia bacterium]
MSDTNNNSLRIDRTPLLARQPNPAHIGTYGLVTWPLVMQANGAVLIFQGVRRE